MEIVSSSLSWICLFLFCVFFFFAGAMCFNTAVWMCEDRIKSPLSIQRKPSVCSKRFLTRMDELVDSSKINGIINVPSFDFYSSQRDDTFVTWPESRENREPVCCLWNNCESRKVQPSMFHQATLILDTGWRGWSSYFPARKRGKFCP